MKINIHELKNKSEMEIEGTQPIVLYGLQTPYTKTECSVKVKGRIFKKDQDYRLQGIGQTTLPLVCDRCLEPFNQSIEIKFDQRYTTNPNAIEEDIKLLPDTVIDLEDIITEAVSLMIPMKRLHDEQCKGICTVCGVNLNIESCHCKQEEIDPRLEGLKDLFHSNS